MRDKKKSKLISDIRLYARIFNARINFWEFCRLIAPDFYKSDRQYLIDLCNVLQLLYDNKLTLNGKPCKKLMINMPPQHGKSRTLMLFCAWILGRCNDEKIIAASYNDTIAADFSRGIREIISMREQATEEVLYSQVFPGTRLNKKNASAKKWAVSGRHFNCLSAGIGGSVTSKGATVLIVDDPIKGAYDAFNENTLNKLWQWYTGTFISRVAAKNGEPIEIINMTRWAVKDLCGRILSSKSGGDWYVIKHEAFNTQTNEMLCPVVLSKSRYDFLGSIMDKAVFMANYHQEPFDKVDKQYNDFLTYVKRPERFERIVAYADTADTGTDNLCLIIAGFLEKRLYVLNVYYTPEPIEVTEEAVCRLLSDYDVNTVVIESNNGGRAFARNVKDKLMTKYERADIAVKWFFQSMNKTARINTNASTVMQKVFFPVNADELFPEFMKDLRSYAKGAKNLHDDAPDALTGLVEKFL